MEAWNCRKSALPGKRAEYNKSLPNDPSFKVWKRENGLCRCLLIMLAFSACFRLVTVMLHHHLLHKFQFPNIESRVSYIGLLTGLRPKEAAIWVEMIPGKFWWCNC